MNSNSTSMDHAFEVYRYYLALKLHFTTDKYDAIQQQGRVRATKQSFLKRNDLSFIRRIASTYSDKEVVDFLVSNFIAGDRWGGLFDTSANERYTNWKHRIESLTYLFQKEISRIQLYCEKSDIEFRDCFTAYENQHPLIIKMFLRNDVSIETLVILNQLLDFVSDLDRELSNDLVWPDISRTIKKYTPFLDIKREKYASILNKIIN